MIPKNIRAKPRWERAAPACRRFRRPTSTSRTAFEARASSAVNQSRRLSAPFPPTDAAMTVPTSAAATEGRKRRSQRRAGSGAQERNGPTPSSARRMT